MHAYTPAEQSDPTDGAHAITVTDVTKRFGDTTALDDLTLTVDRGDSAVVLGPNGSGKTTLIRLLNGALSPTTGTLQVFDIDLATDPRPAQTRSGVVTESLSLYDRFSGRYNLAFYGRLYGLDEARIARRVDDLAELLDLTDFLDDRVETYSTGMQKRLQLARALLHDPDILYLDEPTNGLDPRAARNVVDHITTIRDEQQVTVLLCTHDLQVAERVATHIYFLDDGRLRTTGTPTELRASLWPETTATLVVSGDPDTLREALSGLDWVLDLDISPDAGPFPGATRASVDLSERDRIPDLVDALVDADVRLYHLDEVDHSLEDIYFRVQGAVA